MLRDGGVYMVRFIIIVAGLFFKMCLKQSPSNICKVMYNFHQVTLILCRKLNEASTTLT